MTENTPSGTRCTKCLAVYDERGWQRLRLAERVDAREVARIVLGWPVDDHVEVRECRACGKGISTRRRGGAA